MTTGKIISGSCTFRSLMGHVWFNYNRVFSEFGFIFSNLKWVWVLVFLSYLVSIIF